MLEVVTHIYLIHKDKHIHNRIIELVRYEIAYSFFAPFWWKQPLCIWSPQGLVHVYSIWSTNINKQKSSVKHAKTIKYTKFILTYLSKQQF